MDQWRRRKMRMRNNRPLLLQALGVAVALLILCGAAQANGKTIYVHILDGDDARGDGSYSRPYKSWRVVLSNAGSGDTIIAKNGDYRKAGREGDWGGLSLALTMADELKAGDPRQTVPQGTPPDAIGIYRYEPANPAHDTCGDKAGCRYRPCSFSFSARDCHRGIRHFPESLLHGRGGKEAQSWPRWNSRR
jgi:hypothetical protein